MDYDKWKLASPYDNEPDYEVYKAEDYSYYTMDVDTIEKFDDGMKRAYELGFDVEKFDTKEEYLEEFAEYLAELLDLSFDENMCLEEYLQNKGE